MANPADDLPEIPDLTAPSLLRSAPRRSNAVTTHLPFGSSGPYNDDLPHQSHSSIWKTEHANSGRELQ